MSTRMTTAPLSIETIVARWRDPAARPLFKGCLIDDSGCCCAQGDVLRVAGWSDDGLRQMSQDLADAEVAKLLGISRAHAVLLRVVNDRADGCPQDVLANPERVLGDMAGEVLRFWSHMEAMTDEKWAAAWDAAWAAAGAAAWDAAWATNEIQGIHVLRKRGREPFFLSIFGFVVEAS